MPKRTSTTKKDVNEIATAIIDVIDSMEDNPPKSTKNPAAVELGKLGGKKGGKARAKKLTPEQRSAIAKKAADSRWFKNKREHK